MRMNNKRNKTLVGYLYDNNNKKKDITNVIHQAMKHRQFNADWLFCFLYSSIIFLLSGRYD